MRADPHVIFDDNWCGWRRYLTLFDAMLVPIDDTVSATGPDLGCQTSASLLMVTARAFVGVQFEATSAPILLS